MKSCKETKTLYDSDGVAGVQLDRKALKCCFCVNSFMEIPSAVANTNWSCLE